MTMMTRQFARWTAAVAALVAMVLAGCGGGGNAHRPPVTATTVTFTGQVLLPQAAAPRAVRTASAAGTQFAGNPKAVPVGAGLTVMVRAWESGQQASASVVLETFTAADVAALKAQGTVLGTATTDDQGRYTMTVPGLASVAGRTFEVLAVLTSSRVLQAPVQSTATGLDATVTQNLTLDTTVEAVLARTGAFQGKPLGDVREVVALGQADTVKEQVRAHLLGQGQGTTITNASAQTAQAEAQALAQAEAAQCEAGQTWCSFSSPVVVDPANPEVKKARLVLKKRTVAGVQNTGTIGAGKLTMRLPAGMTLAGLESDLAEKAQGLTYYALETDGVVNIIFLFDAEEGVDTSGSLLTFLLQGPTPDATQYLNVEDFDLRGVLAEKRASSTGARVAGTP